MSRQTILQVAKEQLGETEHPAKSNVTKFNLWFGLSPAEWCAISISYVYAMAGHSLPIMDFLKGFASVPWGWLYWSHRGCVVTDPKPGDIVFFDWQKGTSKEGVPDHVGIFISWIDRAKGLLETYEGNSSGSERAKIEGGEFEHRTDRNMNFVHGFVSPLNLPA